MTVATTIAGAQIIHVPGDYPTIQAGIDAAQFWSDTVLVAEGTYYENIDFNGKFITVASHFVIDGDTNHINNTIIDGSQPANPNYGSVVYFHSGEDTNSVICGFTITGGTGVYVPALNLYGGGGIGIENYSGAKIIHNHIEYNTIESSGSGGGGGIGAGDASNNNYVVIRNNRVCNNSVIANEISEGGGIFILCNAIIKDNIVRNNTATAETETAVGGGIRVVGFYTERYIECSGNLIAHNEVYSSSMSFYGGAGGLSVFRCYGVVSNNRIMNNSVNGTLGAIGGAMHMTFCDSSLLLERNLIADNAANLDYTGVSRGGGIYLYESSVWLVNNMITRNYADEGAGIHIYKNKSGPLRVINNTIAFNEWSGMYLDEADAVVLNTILWNDGFEIFLDNANAEVAYSNVFGGWPGEGNINEEPCFDDDTCHLHCANSPCIDGGTEDFVFSGIKYSAPLFDFDGDARPLDMGFDIGADEALSCEGIAGNYVNDRPFSLSATPNPSTGSPTVKYILRDKAAPILSVMSTGGKQIQLVEIEKQDPGIHFCEPDLSHLPNGIYLLRLQAGEMVETTKVVLMK